MKFGELYSSLFLTDDLIRIEFNIYDRSRVDTICPIDCFHFDISGYYFSDLPLESDLFDMVVGAIYPFGHQKVGQPINSIFTVLIVTDDLKAREKLEKIFHID